MAVDPNYNPNVLRDVPDQKALDTFQAMLKDLRAPQEAKMAAAQAKRERRHTRNLLHSQHVRVDRAIAARSPDL